MYSFDTCHFEFEGERFVLNGNPYWPAAVMPDGRLVRFCDYRMPFLAENFEVVTLDWLWNDVLTSERFVAKPRTSLPSNWFRWEGVRYESVFCPSPIGCVNNTVLRVGWEYILDLPTSEYTVEQAEDIKSYFSKDEYESLVGILRDSYRANQVIEVPSKGALLSMLPVAKYFS
jgi:hypothetical protein